MNITGSPTALTTGTFVFTTMRAGNQLQSRPAPHSQRFSKPVQSAL
jgi:hypothetical protein